MAEGRTVIVHVYWLLKVRGFGGIWVQGFGRNPKHWALYVYLPHRGYSISLHGVSRV